MYISPFCLLFYFRWATCMIVALFCIEIILCRWLQQQIMSIRTVGVCSIFAYSHFAPSYILPVSKVQKSVNISIYTDGYAYIFCSFRSFVVSKFRWKIKCKMKLTTKIDWHDPRRFFFSFSFSVTAQSYRHKRLLPSIQYLSVCVCLSVVPSIENREWGRRIIVVTEENLGLKGIGLQEMDRVVDLFDRQPTRPSVITLLWYNFFLLN